MATADGTVKKSKLEEFANVRRSGLIAINLEKGDTLNWVAPTTGTDEVVITTASGQAIHFKESDVRPMGRNAAGVRGIKLRTGDHVVAMDVVAKGTTDRELLILSENGYGKRSDLKHYKIQKRGGSGIKTMNVTAKTGKLVSAYITSPAESESDMLVTSEKGIIIRVPFASVPLLSRVTQGVRVMRPQVGDRVGAFTLL
jgi:DNA gyrase subunit A